MQNNKTMVENGKQRKYIWLIGFIAVNILGMCLFWNMKLADDAMPIQYTVNHSDKLTISNGSIHEIVIQHKKKKAPVTIITPSILI